MRLVPVLFSLLLAACAATPPAERTAHFFHDHLFGPPSQPIDAAEIFAPSEAMRHYVRVEIADAVVAKGRQKALYDALYSANQLKLDYDAAITRTASQAFAARSGNCLSLVIMTAALAKELGLAVRYQRVFGEEMWSRSGDLYFSNGHVNVTLGRRAGDPRVHFDEQNLLTIDFLPLRATEKHHAWEIGEQTVVAMFMNNRAAEKLAEGRLDDAYAWARAAIRADPRFLAAYNTLGVVYRHHRNLAEAEQVLRHVAVLEPQNPHALSNLALVLRDQGRVAEADALARRVAEIQPYPPFHYFNRGLAAMTRRDFQAARDFFAKEVERDHYYHEFHFWLAAAYMGLGDTIRARNHLSLALENSSTAGERQIYAAKLARIPH